MIIISVLGTILRTSEVFFLSTVKFILAAPLSYLNGFSFIETLAITTFGGIAGVLFFYYFSEFVFGKMRIWFNLTPKKSNTSKFSEMLNKKYGVAGIVILTPVLLSIPLGTVLANKYYSNQKNIPLYLVVSVCCWALVFSSFYNLFV